MEKFICPVCKHEFHLNFWVWLFTTPFHWFNFSDLRDYRKTKCPNCGQRHYMKREK